MSNTLMCGIVLLVGILPLVILILLIQYARKNDSKGTIAPYSEIKHHIKEGTGKPFTLQGGPQQPQLSWDQIAAIPNPDKRYLEMGAFVTHKELHQGYEALSENERLIFHIYTLEGEVNNGGFDQFFFNSAGNYALETVESLGRIGSTVALDLVSRAVNGFGPTPPSSDRETRWAQMEMLPEATASEWNRLDEAFFDIQESLPDLVLNFVESAGWAFLDDGSHSFGDIDLDRR